MALVKCGECGHDVSNQVKSCPNCGARMRKAVSRVQIAMWVVLLAILFWYFFGGGNEWSAVQDWQRIRTQVANEAVASYQMAKKHGDAKDMCVQAGEAANAFLQAHDDAQYQTWKDTEKADCKVAGMAQ